MHASVCVLDHCQLINFPELLKDGLEVLLLQIPWDLHDEEIYSVGLLHWDGGENSAQTHQDTSGGRS